MELDIVLPICQEAVIVFSLRHLSADRIWVQA